MTSTTDVDNFAEDISEFGVPGFNITLNGNFTSTNPGTRRPRPRRPLRFKSDPLLQGIHTYQYYGYPILLTVGSIGNILAYLVFTRTRLSKVSSVQYLAAIAVTDSGFLWTFFLSPLYSLYGVPIIIQVGMCQFMTFLNFVFTFLCIWYLTALVVEKFIGVYWPLKKSTMCTVFRAKLVLVFMAVIAVACYSYIVYFFGVVHMGKIRICYPWKELEKHFTNLSKIDVIVVAVLPYAIIIVLTSLIVIRGCEYYRISAAVELWPRQGASRPATQAPMRVTKVLLPVIIMTIVFNLPVSILRAAMALNGRQLKPSLMAWNALFLEFYILSFAIKIFVYFLSSGSFRRRAKELFRSCGVKLKHSCFRKCSSNSDPQRISMQPMPRTQNARACLVQSDI